MRALELVLRGDFITLDALLKSTGLAPSGGAAKTLIAEGRVQVDGQDELRKTCKVRAGQVVKVGDARIRVVAPPAEALAGESASHKAEQPSEEIGDVR
jgi:ribosome-associated protein